MLRLIFPHIIGAGSVHADSKSSNKDYAFSSSLVLCLSQFSSSSENAPDVSELGYSVKKMLAQVLDKDTTVSLALPLQLIPNNCQEM